MNKKITNTLKAVLIVGVIGATGFSVIASPVTKDVVQKESEMKGPVVCPIGYIEDTIVAINEETKTITIGTAEEEASHIVINVDAENTVIRANDKKVYKFEDLQVGQVVGIESNGIMTDGELNAFEIMIVAENDVQVSTCLVAGYIQETVVAVDVEANQIILGDKEDKEAQIIVDFADYTTVKGEKDKMVYGIKDIQVGSQITLESNGVMTNGVVTAIEITLH